MRMGLRSASLFSASLMFAVIVATAQTNRPTASEMLAKLSSTDPLQRASAFLDLEKIGALRGTGASEILLDLLDRENRLIETTLRESGGESGISVKYGEEFAEYYAMVLGACNERCDKKNQRTPVVLANGAFGGSGDFAQQLARDYGRAILPALLQKTHSDLDIFRANGIRMIGVVQLANPTLTAAENASIRNAVIAATRDTSIPVRQNAVETLGKIGTIADLALLSDIAKRDDGNFSYRGGTRYPVREQAEKAIASIRQRNR